VQPVSPVLNEDYKPFEKVYAKDQPEDHPLPVIRDPHDVLLSRWRPSDDERAAIANGADIMLSNHHTLNEPLQPVLLEVCGDHPDDVAALARRMQLPVPRPLPLYKCHKQVRALKIREVVFDDAGRGEAGRGASLMPEDQNFGAIRVDVDFLRKHDPTPCDRSRLLREDRWRGALIDRTERAPAGSRRKLKFNC
jgi:hypothetical protein